MSRIFIPGQPERKSSAEKKIITDHNVLDVDEGTTAKRAQTEAAIAKRVGTALVQRFPGRQWKVQVDIDGRMLIVACNSVSYTKGYHISMKGRTLKDITKRALYGAAEILERHNLARSIGFDSDTLETMVRDTRDNVITPDSAPEPI